MFRAQYLILKAVSGFNRFFFTRFTVVGGYVVALAAFFAVIGLDTNRNSAYQVFTLLFFIVFSSIVVSFILPKPKVSIRRSAPKYGTAGEPLFYNLTACNLSKRAIVGASVLEEYADPRPGYKEFSDAVGGGFAARLKPAFGVWKRLLSKEIARGVWRPLPDIPSGLEAMTRVEILPLRRGRLSFTNVRVAIEDPLGIVRRSSVLPADDSVLILPKRYKIKDIALPGSRAYQPGGVSMSTSVADAEEFQSLREYRPGDPMRLIHWKSWARTGTPVIKEYQEEYFVRHALVLDTFIDDSFYNDEVFEEAVSVAASFALNVQTRESLLDLMFVGEEAYVETIGRGQGQSVRLLEVLSGVRPASGKDFKSLHALVGSRAALISGCICVFAVWDDKRKEFLEHLMGLGIPILPVLVAPGGDLKVSPPGNVKILKAGSIEEGLQNL